MQRTLHLVFALTASAFVNPLQPAFAGALGLQIPTMPTGEYNRKHMDFNATMLHEALQIFNEKCVSLRNETPINEVRLALVTEMARRLTNQIYRPGKSKPANSGKIQLLSEEYVDLTDITVND